MATIQIADKTTLDAIKSLLDNSTYGLSALKTAIVSGSSAIKSIQRGNVNASATTNGIKTITINSVNINKAFVIANGYTSSGSYLYVPMLYFTNSTTLSYYSQENAYHRFSWQVIEFY